MECASSVLSKFFQIGECLIGNYIGDILALKGYFSVCLQEIRIGVACTAHGPGALIIREYKKNIWFFMFHTWKSFLSESGTYAADRKPHSFLSAFSGKGKRIIFQAVSRFLQAEYSRHCLPASGYSGFIVLHKQIHDIFQA